MASVVTVGAVYGVYKLYYGGAEAVKKYMATTPSKPVADADLLVQLKSDEKTKPLSEAVAKADAALMAAEAELANFDTLAPNQVKKVADAQAAFDQASKIYEDYIKQSPIDKGVQDGYMGEKVKAENALKAVQAVVVPTSKEALTVQIAKLKLAKHQAEGAVLRHEVNVAELEAKIKAPN